MAPNRFECLFIKRQVSGGLARVSGARSYIQRPHCSHKLVVRASASVSVIVFSNIPAASRGRPNDFCAEPRCFAYWRATTLLACTTRERVVCVARWQCRKRPSTASPGDWLHSFCGHKYINASRLPPPLGRRDHLAPEIDRWARGELARLSSRSPHFACLILNLLHTHFGAHSPITIGLECATLTRRAHSRAQIGAPSPVELDKLTLFPLDLTPLL